MTAPAAVTTRNLWFSPDENVALPVVVVVSEKVTQSEKVNAEPEPTALNVTPPDELTVALK